MVDDELMGQARHDLAGGGVVICDICGRAVQRPSVAVVSGRDANDMEGLLICSECRAAIARGDLDLPGVDDESIDLGLA